MREPKLPPTKAILVFFSIDKKVGASGWKKLIVKTEITIRISPSFILEDILNKFYK